MACASQALLSANTCQLSSPSRLLKYHTVKRKQQSFIRATADELEDCNVEECAPDKEVGKISVEWLAGDKTKVVGTFPPRKKWSGYVEKDTAGQTNIYSIEPAVYVAESAISSGTAGSSADGAENNAAIAAGLALVFVAACSSVLIQVSKNPSPVQTLEYSGPSLSYYINKFKPPEIIQASVPSQIESSAPEQPESSTPDLSQVQVESDFKTEPLA